MNVWFLFGIMIATAVGSVEGKVMKQSSEGLPRWADSKVFEVNKEPAHAFSLVFPDEKSARPELNWDNPFAGYVAHYAGVCFCLSYRGGEGALADDRFREDHTGRGNRNIEPGG